MGFKGGARRGSAELAGPVLRRRKDACGEQVATVKKR